MKEFWGAGGILPINLKTPSIIKEPCLLGECYKWRYGHMVSKSKDRVFSTSTVVPLERNIDSIYNIPAAVAQV